MRDKHDGAKGPPAGKLYFGQRAGLDAPQLEFAKMRSLVVAAYSALETAGWFNEWFGYTCVDAGDIEGKAGADLNGFLLTRLWLPDLWPLRQKLLEADETVLFSAIELLYDCVSEPKDGHYHSWNSCGWHYETFDGAAGQTRWRGDMNRILQHYGDGFELSANGEVQKLGASGVRELLKQPVPKGTPRNDREKVENAVRAYRHFSATRPQRIDAVRNLVDVLELYRQQLKVSELSADEKDLYNIANNFAIRHYNKGMKDQYSDDFVDWLFHMYLATVHLMLRLVHGSEPTAPDPEPAGALDDEFPF